MVSPDSPCQKLSLYLSVLLSEILSKIIGGKECFPSPIYPIMYPVTRSKLPSHRQSNAVVLMVLASHKSIPLPPLPLALLFRAAEQLPDLPHFCLLGALGSVISLQQRMNTSSAGWSPTASR